MSPSSLHPGMLTGLILCRFYADNHIWCVSSWEHQFRGTQMILFFTPSPPYPHILLLQRWNVSIQRTLCLTIYLHPCFCTYIWEPKGHSEQTCLHRNFFQNIKVGTLYCSIQWLEFSLHLNFRILQNKKFTWFLEQPCRPETGILESRLEPVRRQVEDSFSIHHLLSPSTRTVAWEPIWVPHVPGKDPLNFFSPWDPASSQLFLFQAESMSWTMKAKPVGLVWTRFPHMLLPEKWELSSRVDRGALASPYLQVGWTFYTQMRMVLEESASSFGNG